MNELRRYLDDRLVVAVGDITTFDGDAIVNAANSSLLGGGGVDGAIHAAGGPRILEACREIRANDYPDGLPPGRAVATTGGELPASHVIHTVGPVWHGGSDGEDELLVSAYRESLRVAHELGATRLAFPAISTGVYHFPRDRAARLAYDTIRRWFDDHAPLEAPREVVLVFFTRADADAFVEAVG
ncbi:MAG: O-acetyl-ADP-ribose deacetylase [Spirochaetota bacterium]